MPNKKKKDLKEFLRKFWLKQTVFVPKARVVTKVYSKTTPLQRISVLNAVLEGCYYA